MRVDSSGEISIGVPSFFKAVLCSPRPGVSPTPSGRQEVEADLAAAAGVAARELELLLQPVAGAATVLREPNDSLRILGDLLRRRLSWKAVLPMLPVLQLLLFGVSSFCWGAVAGLSP
mmetsp:Transcript_10087/g.19453  ORF Transcript_10087/g.19453 Transcript_10087/m.19453 type:complete len:118 (+) Transcript_10087:345-698(+)